MLYWLNIQHIKEKSTFEMQKLMKMYSHAMPITLRCEIHEGLALLFLIQKCKSIDSHVQIESYTQLWDVYNQPPAVEKWIPKSRPSQLVIKEYRQFHFIVQFNIVYFFVWWLPCFNWRLLTVDICEQ